MSSIAHRQRPPLRFLAITILGLLLTACATPKHPSDMSESQRIRAAKAGNLAAIRSLQSINYHDKAHNSHDRAPAESLKWLRKGAEMNDPYSQITLAEQMLFSSQRHIWPVERNPAEALRLANAAVAAMAKPDKDGQPFQPWRVKESKEIAQRAEVIATQTPLAEKGDADAMWALSQAYAPRGTSRSSDNPTKAEEEMWRLKAAEAGQPDAAMAMAARTFGDESLKWKQKAASRDNPEAMFEMAESFRFKGDEKTALEWFRKAAAKGHAPAKKSVLQLTDPTVVRLKAAAKSGDVAAMYQLGEYFRSGNWNGKDAAMAQQWYGSAASKGHLQGMYRAALGITINDADQERAMRAAAAAGSTDAASWVASRERAQASEQQRKQNEADASRRQAAARQQQQYDQQQAFVARIDREGSTDMATVEQYCNYGGRRCDALRVGVRRAMESGNAAAASANQQRIQDYTRNGGKSQEQLDKEARDRLACTQRNTQAIQNNTAGKTDWAYKECD
ncbi:MAG: Sel1 domain protein repeat-containing protein [Moraxellaceae bacterium]|jgi:TPR repeat protein|nr:Sel1 domain protein repeat-containing protein [Moraxellaceae bacterium]